MGQQGYFDLDVDMTECGQFELFLPSSSDKCPLPLRSNLTS